MSKKVGCVRGTGSGVGLPSLRGKSRFGRRFSIRQKKYTVWDYVGISFKVMPFLTTLNIIGKVVNALIPSLQVLVTAAFVDTAISIFEGAVAVNAIYVPLIYIAALLFYQYVVNTAMGLISAKMRVIFSDVFRVAVVEKRARLKYQHIENNDTWELLKRIGDGPATRMSEALDVILNMVQLVVRVVSILAVLMTNVWWAGLIILAFTVPLLVLATKSGKANYTASKEAAKYTRKADYLHEVLFSRDNVEERTLFQYSEKLNDEWLDKSETARKIEAKTLTSTFVKMKGSSLITVVVSALIAGVLIAPLASGLLSVGLFMGLVTASFNLVQVMSWELSSFTKDLANHSEYMKDLTKFSHLDECQGALDLPDKEVQKIEPDSIKFDNVSFKYPQTENYILKNMSFEIEKGKHYAIVGINGAGKTTLTKILTGLYDNFEGEIYIGGKNLREFSSAQLKGIFSVVYQDFAKYEISAKENIALGDINGCSDVEIQNAVDFVGLTEAICQLPKGVDTNLGKTRGEGVDISGGQWQRLALARALVSKAPVRILDEPTAALDPVAESDVYEMFGRVSVGKTTIFITHRLGAAKLADEILVVDDGKILEKGSHEQLIKQKGLYFDMFESQRSWYV